jgi:hypothetical protein
MSTAIKGTVRVWGLTESKREYINVSTTYGEARLLFKSDPYSALSGKGEQRGIVENHAKRLRREMEAGTFTPCSFHVGVRKNQLKNVQYEEVDGLRTATVPLDGLETLPLTNGGHRFQALNWIRDEAEKAVKDAKAVEAKATTDEAKAEAANAVVAAEAFLELVDNQPIEAMVLLNGSTQDDFINLQYGKPVDQAHMLSLKIARGQTNPKSTPFLKLAFSIAKALNGGDANSPFYRQIRFDSRGFAALPISTLCPKGASDLSCSLTGLAKVGQGSKPAKSAEWLADVVNITYKILADKAPELIKEGKVLTPPPNGTKGSATLLIGVAVALAYRMMFLNEDKVSDRTKGVLVDAAKETLDNDVNGNFSGPAKRGLIGAFVKEFFSDLTNIEKHEGVPLELVKTISSSAYDVSPLPKAKKATPTPAVVETPTITQEEEIPTTTAAPVLTGEDMLKELEMLDAQRGPDDDVDDNDNDDDDEFTPSAETETADADK